MSMPTSPEYDPKLHGPTPAREAWEEKWDEVSELCEDVHDRDHLTNVVTLEGVRKIVSVAISTRETEIAGRPPVPADLDDMKRIIHEVGAHFYDEYRAEHGGGEPGGG